MLSDIHEDITALLEHGPECPLEKLKFQNVMPLYHVFMSRADAWLAKLGKERGQSQAIALSARTALAVVSGAFSATLPAVTADTTLDAHPLQLTGARRSVTGLLQALSDAGNLRGVAASTDKCCITVSVPGGNDATLDAPGVTLINTAIMRELFIIETGIGMPSQLPTAMQGVLATNWNRVRVIRETHGC